MDAAVALRPNDATLSLDFSVCCHELLSRSVEYCRQTLPAFSQFTRSSGSFVSAAVICEVSMRMPVLNADVSNSEIIRVTPATSCGWFRGLARKFTRMNFPARNLIRGHSQNHHEIHRYGTV